MQNVSEQPGIDQVNLVKVLDFLPYPFLVTEFRDGAQHTLFVNESFKDEIGYSREDIPTLSDWFMIAYPNKYYRNEIMFDWSARIKSAREAGEESIAKQSLVHTRHHELKWYELKASVFDKINFVAFIKITDKKDRALSI